MLKSKILKTGILVLLSSIIVTGCGGTSQAPANKGNEAQKEKSITIKFAHSAPDNGHPVAEGYKKFKEIVNQKSNGQINVELYPNSQLGGEREVTEGIQTGVIQMGSASAPNLSQFTTSFLAIDLPYTFPTSESADKVLDGELGKVMLDNFKSQTGIMGLGFVEIGYRHIYNNVKPIEKLEDLKGLKIRTTSSPLHIDTIKALGASATPMGWNEVFTGLQQGTVDGIDVDVINGYYGKFYEVQKYLTLVGSSYSPHVVMINEKFFKGLSPENQKIITDAVNEVEIYERKLFRESEANFIKEMEKKGMKVNVLSKEEKQRFAAAVKPVQEANVEKVGREFYSKIQATVK